MQLYSQGISFLSKSLSLWIASNCLEHVVWTCQLHMFCNIVVQFQDIFLVVVCKKYILRTPCNLCAFYCPLPCLATLPNVTIIIGSFYLDIMWVIFINLRLCRSSLCITCSFLKLQTKSSGFCAELFDTASVPAVLAITHSFYLNWCCS